MASKEGRVGTAVVWLRKCLRLHDNAALVEAARAAIKHVCVIFVIDPHFVGPNRVCVNRYNFLLESLCDLDAQLKAKYGSRLFVLRGSPKDVFTKLLKSGKPLLSQPPELLLWERDTEPYARARDEAISRLAEDAGVEVRSFVGHTMYDVDEALRRNKGKAPSTMPGMVTLAKVLGEPSKPLPPPAKLLAPPKDALARANSDFMVPSLKQMGYTAPQTHCGFPGGETSGLARLAAKLKDTGYICKFEKPKTRSTAFDPPSTTVLSPYLKFGCVSVRRFYHDLMKVYAGKAHSKPPASLLGQLYFREMAYFMGASIPHFDKQAGNPACKPIPWGTNAKHLSAWEKGLTGYPFIDAAMRQLVRTGWLHHLARHAVACFLTRGDLWVSWEKGRDVFDKYLLDADWALNNMNWLALSGVAPWSPPFFRVYHPAPKQDSALNLQDPDGCYIREFVPELKDMPSKFIYEPWTAPLEVQKKAGCVIGKDYPRPIVDHANASRDNLARFKKALDAAKKGSVSAAAKKNGDASGPTKRAAPKAAGGRGKRPRT